MLEKKLKKKRDLPSFIHLPYQWDIDKMREEYLKVAEIVGEYNTTPQDMDYMLHRYDKHFLPFFDFDKYHYINLTDFNEERTEPSKYNILQWPIKGQKNIDEPRMDERNYDKKNKYCNEFWSNILDTFKSPVTRAKFVIMHPHSEIKAHYDYNTDFCIRVQIPIFTNPDVKFVIERTEDKSIEELHMPADGTGWFINAGMNHWVINDGDTKRIHLMLTVVGQDDLV